jgi:hypothetical protein
MLYGRDLWRSGGAGKAEAAKLPGAGIGPKQCPRKCAAEKGGVLDSVQIVRDGVRSEGNYGVNSIQRNHREWCCRISKLALNSVDEFQAQAYDAIMITNTTTLCHVPQERHGGTSLHFLEKGGGVRMPEIVRRRFPRAARRQSCPARHTGGSGSPR